MISLVSYHPPAAVDALVAEVFGDCLAADLADGYVGKCCLVELEAARVAGVKDDALGRHVSNHAVQEFYMVALDVPIAIQSLAVRKRRRVDDRQVERLVFVQRGEKLAGVFAAYP